eukprot:350767-Chlamydomonas_euryale.AAC.7
MTAAVGWSPAASRKKEHASVAVRACAQLRRKKRGHKAARACVQGTRAGIHVPQRMVAAAVRCGCVRHDGCVAAAQRCGCAPMWAWYGPSRQRSGCPDAACARTRSGVAAAGTGRSVRVSARGHAHAGCTFCARSILAYALRRWSSCRLACRRRSSLNSRQRGTWQLGVVQLLACRLSRQKTFLQCGQPPPTCRRARRHKVCCEGFCAGWLCRAGVQGGCAG